MAVYKPSDTQSKILQEIHASKQEYFRMAKAKAKKKAANIIAEDTIKC